LKKNNFKSSRIIQPGQPNTQIMTSIYQNITDLLKKHEISFKEYDHDPILSYEDAEREAKRFGWQGVESKNVFMKGSDGNYYLYVTTQGNNVDFKMLKNMLNVKLSIAKGEDVENVINCVPGCVAPFGFDENIIVLLDVEIFDNDDYLFSPGVTTKTIQTNIKDLKVIFDNLPNKVIQIS